MVTKNGRTITCEWFNTPLVDKNGEVIGVASMFEDVTERERLALEIETLASFPRFNPNPVFQFGPDAQLQYFNNAAEEMVKTLDQRESTILSYRFGLDGGPERTLEEVGEKFGVTRERIRQIQEIALKKMRAAIEKRENPDGEKPEFAIAA